MPGACIIHTVALLDAIISAWCSEEVYIVPGQNERRGDTAPAPIPALVRFASFTTGTIFSTQTGSSLRAYLFSTQLMIDKYPDG